MSLVDALKAEGYSPDSKPKPLAAPLWKGPEVDGVTFSMLSRFLVCRERFRLYAVEGLRVIDQFNSRIEYGQMWHTCEEALAAQTSWEESLKAHAVALCAEYPTQQAEVNKWWNVCKRQFPVYVDYWQKNHDVKNRVPLLQEQVFDVEISLPPGRKVRLRGKWDAVDLILKGKGQGVESGVFVQENKTKGTIDERKLNQQLTFDLQSMIYMVAVKQQADQARGVSDWEDKPLADAVAKHGLKGIRYNVIRRPLSGGKGTVVQHKPSKSNPRGESEEEYYARMAGYFTEFPDEFFMRWKVYITDAEIDDFRKTCLEPLLRQVCEWYDHVTMMRDLRRSPFDPTAAGYAPHWRHPYGVYNVLNEGGSTDVDEYLLNGSTVGLRRVEKLFTELTPA